MESRVPRCGEAKPGVEVVAAIPDPIPRIEKRAHAVGQEECRACRCEWEAAHESIAGVARDGVQGILGIHPGTPVSRCALGTRDPHSKRHRLLGNLARRNHVLPLPINRPPRIRKMNSLLKILRRTLEKLTDRYHEGPETPARFRDSILLFRAMNPMAGIDDLILFASAVVDDAYRQGFARGYEWRERGLLEPGNEAERAADEAAHDWDVTGGDPRLRAILESGEDPNDPLRGVPPEERAKLFDTLGAYFGTHRVVVVDEDGKRVGYPGEEDEGLPEFIDDDSDSAE